MSTERHVVTVRGIMLCCTCGFQDMAGEPSVRSHAATHDPVARIEVVKRKPVSADSGAS